MKPEYMDYPTGRYKVWRSCDLSITDKANIIHAVIVEKNTHKYVAMKYRVNIYYVGALV